MTPGPVPVGLLLSSLGLSAVDAAQSGGLDLLGIAAVITALSGLIATIGALVIGLRKKDSSNDALVQALEKLAENQKGEP